METQNQQLVFRIIAVFNGMRRRRHRQLTLPTQNLDSFLDILTNTVGVLMFISLFVTLFSVQVSNIIRTPLVSNTSKQPHFFEIRNNRVTYIDDREVDRQLTMLMDSLPSCSTPDLPEDLDRSAYQYYFDRLQDYESCRNQTVQRLKNFRGKTEHYQVHFVNGEALLYEPILSNGGESVEQLTKTSSEFIQILKRLNSKTDYLAFIVRSDSFSAFRVARKQALKDGFDVGWEPYNTEAPIVFSSGGRAVGVQ